MDERAAGAPEIEEPVASIAHRPGSATRVSHWEAVYASRPADQLSWHEAEPTLSLSCLDALGVPLDGAILDVGGGASRLVDALVARGYRDVRVLDVSARALELARARLLGATGVRFVHGDVLAYRPKTALACWHDRAVFHFLVDPEDRDRYLETLRATVAPGGGVVLATFALDGPEQCSGLPVRRHAPEQLVEAVGPGFTAVHLAREAHVTPHGVTQWFSWAAMRRDG